MIRLGPAGIGNGFDRLPQIKEIGLNAAEVAFVYNIYMNNETAKKIGELAKKLGITLSIHASYYINLNSEDKAKIHASMKRILGACERGYYLGAKYIVFHAAFYGKNKESCYKIVKEVILELQKIIKENKWDVVLCPETTGKISQFGSLDELIKLHKETSCGICIDFAHLLARDGKVDYNEVAKKIKDIKDKTAHFSGINYGDKGEKNHILTKENEIKDLIFALKNNKIDITIINESPDPINDSIRTKKYI